MCCSEKLQNVRLRRDRMNRMCNECNVTNSNLAEKLKKRNMMAGIAPQELKRVAFEVT